MSSFKNYLKERGFATKTIANTQKEVLNFITWLDKQGMEVEEVTHRDLLGYIKLLQKREIKQITIERYLNALKLFYAFQLSIDSIKSNPVSTIKIQGIQRKKLYYTFSTEELNKLYNEYSIESRERNQERYLIGARNKVMLGLYVYQGIQTSELVKLEVKDIDLRQGQITIPSTKRSNPRTLQLESHQVLDIYDYVLQVRNQILAISKQQTEQLFVSPSGGIDQTNYVSALMRELKQQNKLIENAQQLRTSVIVKWLKQYNLRGAQYKAGHKYVSSTESFLVNETEGLAEEISQFHPLG